MRPERDFVIAQLVEDGSLSAENADKAVRQAAEQRIPPAQAAVDMGLVTPEQAAVARAAVSECTFVDLRHFDIDFRNSQLLTKSAAEKRLAFPLFNFGRSVVVGMADPTDLGAVDRLRTLLRTEIEPVLCETTALRNLIERAYSMGGGASSTRSPGAWSTSSRTERRWCARRRCGRSRSSVPSRTAGRTSRAARRSARSGRSRSRRRRGTRTT